LVTIVARDMAMSFLIDVDDVAPFDLLSSGFRKTIPWVGQRAKLNECG